MARVNIFDMVNSISNESVSHPDVNEVKVDAVKDLPDQVQEDPEHVCPDEPISATVSNTATTEPGPTNGGGDGTAKTVDVKTANANMDVADVNENLNRDQNGGPDIDKLPKQVSAKDGLSAGDVSTSVEAHGEQGEEGGESAESSELTSIDSSGTETIERADDLVMDLDGEELEVTGMTDVTEQALSEVDSVAAKADALSKATATVERYHGLMVQMHKEGRYMSDELRQAIAWGLEDIDGEMFKPERVALESYGLEASLPAVQTGARSGQIEDGSDPGEVGKGLSSKLKEMFKAGVRIFWRTVNMISDLITNFSQDTGKLLTHLTDLRKRVSVLDGGKEFTMKGVSRLMIGDEFVGDSKNAIAKVAKTTEETLIAWPNALGKVLQDWKDSRGIFGGTADGYGAVVGSLDTLLERAFRSFDSLTPNDKGKVPSGFLDVDRLNWSGPLPGNMAMYFGSTKADKGIKGEIQQADKPVKIDFSLIPGADAHSAEATVSTPSAGEAVSVIRELEKLCGTIQSSRDGQREIKKFVAGTSHDALMDILTGAGGGHGQVAGIMVMGLGNATLDAQRRYIGYVLNLIKAYIGFMEASLKAEEAGNTIDA